MATPKPLGYKGRPNTSGNYEIASRNKVREKRMSEMGSQYSPNITMSVSFTLGMNGLESQYKQRLSFLMQVLHYAVRGSIIDTGFTIDHLPSFTLVYHSGSKCSFDIYLCKVVIPFVYQ